MRYLINFFKLAVVSWFLIFFLYFLTKRQSAVFYILFCALAVGVILFAIKKKYVVFVKNDWKENVASVIFLLCVIAWFYFSYCRVINLETAYISEQQMIEMWKDF